MITETITALLHSSFRLAWMFWKYVICYRFKHISLNVSGFNAEEFNMALFFHSLFSLLPTRLLATPPSFADNQFVFQSVKTPLCVNPG